MPKTTAPIESWSSPSCFLRLAPCTGCVPAGGVSGSIRRPGWFPVGEDQDLSSSLGTVRLPAARLSPALLTCCKLAAPFTCGPRCVTFSATAPTGEFSRRMPPPLLATEALPATIGAVLGGMRAWPSGRHFWGTARRERDKKRCEKGSRENSNAPRGTPRPTARRSRENAAGTRRPQSARD